MRGLGVCVALGNFSLSSRHMFVKKQSEVWLL